MFLAYVDRHLTAVPVDKDAPKANREEQRKAKNKQ